MTSVPSKHSGVSHEEGWGIGVSTSFPQSPILISAEKKVLTHSLFVRVESDQRFHPSFLIKCLGSLRHIVRLTTIPDKLPIWDGFLLTTSLVMYIFKRSWAIPPLREDPSRVEATLGYSSNRGFSYIY